MSGEPLHIVALSGGKDSTALAIRLLEVEPRDYTYVCTPTGDELPEMVAHWVRLEQILGKEIIKLRAPLDLNGLIDHFKALPNWRQRWCTRILKIEVIREFYMRHPGSVVYVGLRADEKEREGGIFGDYVTQRYPLREWGWAINDVWQYLQEVMVPIPKRTDCARCFFQRLSEWWWLWKQFPDIFADAEAQEERYGHTFRSETKDNWPGALKGLRAEFEAGRIPRGADVQINLFEEMCNDKCRVCSL